MHPILFNIPLPQMPLNVWWGLAIIALISLVSAALGARRGDKSSVWSGLFVAVLAAGGGYYFRDVTVEQHSLPIYSYGVMLGLSLVVGWTLTLTLAERDGLPKETMANCYIVTAVAAIVGARLLYVVTNLSEFHTVADVLALRRGGLVAYGGFLGGFLGSWAFLSRNGIRLLPWADVAAPSIASGLLITRIGCYMFGCDFGKRLPEGAPELLKKLGTFPHWPAGTIEHGDGAPAFLRQMDLFRGTPLAAQITKAGESLPVHPTQIYESLVGLGLLGLLFWQRRYQKFRGQVFFLLAFAYGFFRFVLEIIRDDVERGEYGPTMPEHVLIPGALLLFSLGFIFGISLGIPNAKARLASCILSLAPPAVAYWMLKPPSFGETVTVQLSTSQWFALISALIVAACYASYWQKGIRNPRMAMALGIDGAPVEGVSENDSEEEREAAGEDEDEEEKEKSGEAGKSKKKKPLQGMPLPEGA